MIELRIIFLNLVVVFFLINFIGVTFKNFFVKICRGVIYII